MSYSDGQFDTVVAAKQRLGNLARIRELIFGAQDGLLGTLGLLSTASGAFHSAHPVIITGISAALAGTFSMAIGTYLASKSELEVYRAEINRERYRTLRYPREKEEELVMLLEGEHLPAADSHRVSKEIRKSHESFTNTLIEKELGIDPHPQESPARDALYAASAFAGTSCIPLAPYLLLPLPVALPVSLGLTLISLFVVGLYKGTVTSRPLVASGVEIALWGTVSSLGGLGIGILLLHLV